MRPASTDRGEGMRSGYFVETQRHCFLCLNRISPTVTPTTHSLQYLSRYLRLNLGEVFSKRVHVPPEVEAKLERSELKANLCEECVSLNERFSKLCGQLERVRMEVGNCVSGIYGRLTKTGENVTREELRFRMMEDEDNSFLKILTWQVAEGLRNQAIQKCSNELNRRQPRVLVKKLKLNEMISASPSLGLKLDSGGTDDVEGAHTTLHNDDNPSTPSLKCDISKIKAENVSTHLGEGDQYYEFNVTTRKYHCKLCHKDFSSLRSWSAHFKSVHQKLRQKCPLCDKDFSQPSALSRHHNQMHVGTKFRCRTCHKASSKRSNIEIHQRMSQGVCPSGEDEVEVLVRLETETEKKEVPVPTQDTPNTATAVHFVVPKNEEPVRAVIPPPPPRPHAAGSGPLSRFFRCDEGTGRCTCLICLKTVNSRDYWYIHYKSIHQKVRHRCGQSGRTYSQAGDLQRHKLSAHLRKTFQCQGCSRAFSLITNLAHHYRVIPACQKRKLKKETHTKYNCKLCGWDFTNLKAWKFHSRAVHQTQKPKPAHHHEPKTRQQEKSWECKDCGRVFGSESGVQRHRQSVHMGLRYKCLACNNIFSQRNYLQRHLQKFCRANPNQNQAISQERGFASEADQTDPDLDVQHPDPGGADLARGAMGSDLILS